MYYPLAVINLKAQLPKETLKDYSKGLIHLKFERRKILRWQLIMRQKNTPKTLTMLLHDGILPDFVRQDSLCL